MKTIAGVIGIAAAALIALPAAAQFSFGGSASSQLLEPEKAFRFSADAAGDAIELIAQPGHVFAAMRERIARRNSSYEAIFAALQTERLAYVPQSSER